jgi:hypothetical protein
MNPTITCGQNDFDAPMSESKLVMHRPTPLGVAGVNDDGTYRRLASQQLRDLQASAWVLSRTRQWVQVVIE